MQTTLPLADNVFSVTQITELISEILVTSFKFITIEGEISNWRPSSAGHIYFTLKDDTSQIRAVMFRGAAYGLSFHQWNLIVILPLKFMPVLRESSHR